MRSKFFIFLLSLSQPGIVFAQASFELNTGSERSGIDVIIAQSLDSTSRWALLSRTLASVNHENETSLYSLHGINYSFRGGAGVLMNTTFTPGRFFLTAGLQYTYKTKELYLYLYLTRELGSKDFYDHFLVFVWQPRINNAVNFLLQAELAVTMNGLENNSSLQRLKPGISLRKMHAGAMLEIMEKSRTFSPSFHHAGIFVKKFF